MVRFQLIVVLAQFLVESSCDYAWDYDPYCQDIHDVSECVGWARRRECQRNPTWMNPNCKKSCRVCSSDNIAYKKRVFLSRPKPDFFGKAATDYLGETAFAIDSVRGWTIAGVDLGGSYMIREVRVLPQPNYEIYGTNLGVFVTDNLPRYAPPIWTSIATLCGRIPPSKSGGWKSVLCSRNSVGRYALLVKKSPKTMRAAEIAVYGVPAYKQLMNLAYGKPIFTPGLKSSVNPATGLDYAVDMDGRKGAGYTKVAAAEGHKNYFFVVDLLDIYTVHNVSVFACLETPGQRRPLVINATNYSVHASLQPGTTYDNSGWVWMKAKTCTGPDLPRDMMKTVHCGKDIIGRFVTLRVDKLTSSTHLWLYELQVYGTMYARNVAYKRRLKGPSTRADTNRLTTDGLGEWGRSLPNKCFSEPYDLYLTIDLGRRFHVWAISITNTVAAHYTRAGDFIFVHDEPTTGISFAAINKTGQVCWYSSTVPPAAYFVFCQPAGKSGTRIARPGRLVTLARGAGVTRGSWMICEIEVYVKLSDPPAEGSFDHQTITHLAEVSPPSLPMLQDLRDNYESQHVKTRTVIECAVVCLNDGECKSYRYVDAKNLCVMYPIEGADDSPEGTFNKA